MKKLSFLAVSAMVMLGITFTSCFSKKAALGTSKDAVSFKTDVDSVSYLIGADYGKGLREYLTQFPGTPGNLDAFMAGFLKATKGEPALYLGMGEFERQSFVENYFQSARMHAAEAAQEAADKFLAENKTQSGVITTESGLQYKVITEGTGAKPAATDMVKIHYHGTLLNGEVFDSSVERNEPMELPLSGIIDGLTEGLQLMSVGSKYIFWIPSALAYDQAGTSHQFHGKLLIFEIELLEILTQ